MNFTLPLPTRRATIQLAQALADHVRPSDLVVLSGSLGAGKTFWTRALCRALGLPSREPVTSPTFALVRELPTLPKVAHADLYRLGCASDVEQLGLREYRENGWLLVVEWGEAYEELLGGEALRLSFSLTPREARVFASAERWAPVFRALEARFSGPTGGHYG